MKKQRSIVLLFIISVLILIAIAMQTTSDKTFSDADDDSYAILRQRMVEEQLQRRDIDDEKVLAVMNTVERHQFVPTIVRTHAYNDNPIPIGYGQTISQPYIVALMTQSLDLGEGDRVLEIGTGSGYQAAVLADMVREVYTVEIIGQLAESARERLQSLNYDNIQVKHADGYFGWEEVAPFDAIIVTAAANHIPPPLLQQLSNGGKLVIPLSNALQFQTLTLVTKKDNDFETEFITGVRFVPLTGKALGE